MVHLFGKCSVDIVNFVNFSAISQQLETLKKVMDAAHDAQVKEVTARHEK